MKWVVRVIALFALLLASVFAIGAAIPRDHVASVRAHYPVPADSLFAVIADVTAGPSWRAGIDSVLILSAGEPLRWREIGEYGAVTFERDAFEPPRRIVARIDDAGQPFGGTWTWEVVPAGDSASITITERGWISNPAYRFFSRFVFGYYSTMESYARSLGLRFGAEVEPERIG
jgi:hypothetical protein